MREADDLNTTEIDDLVLIPLIWIPPNILRLITGSVKSKEHQPAHDFYTDELGSNAMFYYIDRMGRLVYKNISMSVVVDESVVGTSFPSLVYNTQHQVVIEPLPNKVYTTIKNKLCTLELYFEDGILKQVKSQL
jgi:hypothetical protein